MTDNFLSRAKTRFKFKSPWKKAKSWDSWVPGMAIMFLLFIIEIFIRDILAEREDGKLQRMMFSPMKTMDFILGRIISAWIMGIAVFAIMAVLGTVLFGISWGNYLYLFLFASVTCSWIAAFFALLNSFFKNRNQAGAFVAPIILVFSVFGGSVIQVDQMPGAVRWVSNVTLNHWFIQGIGKIRDGIFPTAPFAGLLLTALLLFTLAAVFLKKRITI